MTDVSANPPAPNTPEPSEGFDQEVRALVRETAPSRFALVLEFTTEDGQPDAYVAAWGLADPDDGTVRVTSVEGCRTISARSAERAATLVGRLTGELVRLEWLDPEPEPA